MFYGTARHATQLHRQEPGLGRNKIKGDFVRLLFYGTTNKAFLASPPLLAPSASSFALHPGQIALYPWPCIALHVLYVDPMRAKRG